MLELRCETQPGWLPVVLADFDHFLIDHAACERKASATGLAFVVQYPDRRSLVQAMILFAQEELEHFRLVSEVIYQKGLQLLADEKDLYVVQLMKHVRSRGEERLLDRLLVAGIVEARGCERFGLVRDALPAGDLKDLYTELTRSEARHHSLFLRLAREMFAIGDMETRLQDLLDKEAHIVSALPFRPAVH
jgi:tRNA 2-(methylsulfanyl)-N6-isopentenyladenosine37 hydroxylase